ncbi:prephenate dehydrogenase [candidate division KSB1 bacterium]
MEPHFKQVTFIGMGIMAGSLALAFRKYNICQNFVGVSREETIKKAISQKIIDKGYSYDNIDKGVDGSSLIILCSPIHIIIKHIKQLAELAAPGTIITDIGSTKVNIMKTAQSVFPKDVYFVGAHPMAGSEQSGIDNSDADIFHNKAYIIVPNGNTPSWVIDKLKIIIDIIGSFPVILTAEVHDQIVAGVSHLPQILSVVLMNTAGTFDSESHEHLRLAGSGFADMTRIASSHFSIWKDICETNDENIKNAISVFIKELDKLKNLIGKEELRREFEKSNNLRELFNNIKKK